MVAAPQKQKFAIGDRARVSNKFIPGAYGKEGVIQSERRKNGSITLQFPDGKLYSFKEQDLERVELEKSTAVTTGSEARGNRAAESGTERDRSSTTRRGKRTDRSTTTAHGRKKAAQSAEVKPSTPHRPTAKFRVADYVAADYSHFNGPGDRPPGLQAIEHGATGMVSSVKTCSGGIEYAVAFYNRGSKVAVPEMFLRASSFEEVNEHNIAAVTDSPTEGMLATAPTLEQLAGTIAGLWAEIDGAEEVAQQALYSALDSARLCGEALLEAKKQAGHGNWEQFRETLKHPRTGKSMPSSTATLYQRIAERWQDLGDTRTIREAQAVLKKPRLKSATEEEAATGSPPEAQQRDLVASVQAAVDAHSDRSSASTGTTNGAALAAAYGSNVATETAANLAAEGIVPCRPSISPGDFNREMWGTTTPAGNGQRRTISYKPADGGREICGLVLSEPRFMRLVQLSMKFGGSVEAAIDFLIDGMEDK